MTTLTDELDFDKRSEDLGISGLILSHSGRGCDGGLENCGRGIISHGVGSDHDGDGIFMGKLRQFVYYQPLQQYQDSVFTLGVPLASAEGKDMFVEAVRTAYMECYYKISPQVDNQAEYTCSTTCLVVTLNSLGIDPARATWYGEWRWHHLGSLACCSPRLQNPSMTMHQFSCLAVCNDTLALPITVTDDWTKNYFRSWIKMATARSDLVMVVNYGREALCQNGSGHFLPISGYHEGRDMVLLIDVAKHKYPPNWVPLGRMMAALKAPDNRHGGNRGFVLLTRPDYDPGERMFGPSLTLRLDDVPGTVDRRLVSFMTRWNRFLKTNVHVGYSPQEVINESIQHFISSIPCDVTEPRFSLLDLTLDYFRSDHRKIPSVVARCRKPQCPSTCINTAFCQQLQYLDIFKQVQTCLGVLTNQEHGQILDLVVGQLENVDQAVMFAKSSCLGKGKLERIAKYLKDEQLGRDKNVRGSVDERSHQSGRQMNGNGKLECPGYVELLPEHILTFLILSWPFVEPIPISYDTITAFRQYIVDDANLNSTLRADESDLHAVLCKEIQSVPFGDAATQKVEHTGMRSSGVVNNISSISVETPVEHKYLPGTSEKHAANKNVTHTNGKYLSEECNNIMTNSYKKDTVSVCDYMNRFVEEELQNNDSRIMKDQIRAMKRKLVVILKYHNLL